MSDKSMIDLDLAHSLRTLSSTISPVAFAHQLGFTKLDDWQKSFLMATDRYVCVNVCRQAGKTSMAAAICTHAALTRPDSLILIVSPSQRQSHEMLLKIQRFYSTLGKPVPPEQENFYTLTLRNGARIISLPGQNPDQLRGFSAPDIICIDEAAREGKSAWTTYVVDCGGVGVSAVEGLERTRGEAEIIKVFLTGGFKERAPDDETNTIMLPKWQLIATFSGLLEAGQVTFPENAKYADAMIDELESFDRHITDSGAETFAAKVGKHDDLIVAASLCTWFGSRHSPREDHIFW